MVVAIVVAATPVILFCFWLAWLRFGRPHLYRRWVRSLPEHKGERKVRR